MKTQHVLAAPASMERRDVVAPASERAPAVAVRWCYVFAVALPLIVLNCGWIANSEMVTEVTEVTISSLFMCVAFILFVVTLLNLLVRRFVSARASLNQPELMALYAMLSMSAVVAGVGHFGFFMTFLGNAFYYGATANPAWRGFSSSIPACVGPRDPAILQGFYSGNSTFFQVAVMRAWAYPVLWWCAFFLLLIWTTLCASSILRRRWADEEHLPFPVLALPIEMTREGAPIYRSKLLWAGFAIPCCLHSLNSLAGIYPDIPSVHVNSLNELVSLGQLQRPWSGMGTFYAALHPAGVGFGYLVNSEVSFSLWLFYLLRKAVVVFSVTQGWRDAQPGWGADASNFPYIDFQACGAWLMLSFATLWTGRAYFRRYLHRALHGDREGEDREEPMSARLALVGFAAGFVVLCAFVWSWGGSWWLPVAFLSIYIVLVVTMARIRAENPVMSYELEWVNPQAIIPAIVGTRTMSLTDLTHMGTLSWFNLDYRANEMPHEMEGLVGLKMTHARMSPLVVAILASAVVAMLAAAVWDLQMYYTHGAATTKVNSWRIIMGSKSWQLLQSWVDNPKPPQAAAIGAMGAGGVITLFLTLMRARFVGFPLVASGYALNMTVANEYFWMDMFVAWLLKVSIMRYGGMKLYRQCLPFFLGLILGDFITGSVWSIIGTLFKLSLFRTFAT